MDIENKERKRIEKICGEIEVFMNPFLVENSKGLFCVLNLYKNSITGCWASNRFLASLLGCNERSVSRAISSLEEWKYIKVTNKKSQLRRRMFIIDFKSRYSEICDELYAESRLNTNIDLKKYKKMFTDARDKQ